MAGVFIFLILVFGVICFVSTVFFGKATWSSAFEQIALRYGGMFHGANMLRPPAATFNYKQTPCRVRCYRRRFGYRGQFTEFRIAWPMRDLRMEVNQSGPGFSKRGMQPVAVAPTGDASFSQRYEVSSNIAARAIRLISPAVCWQIDQLSKVKPDAGLFVSIDRGWLMVTRSSYLRSKEAVDDFVRYSLELYDQMALTMTEGIEFHDDVIAAMDQMQCPVCSCDIEGRLVMCVRCKTPHCHDCWLYNGKCGMYGCNESRYSMLG